MNESQLDNEPMTTTNNNKREEKKKKKRKTDFKCNDEKYLI